MVGTAATVATGKKARGRSGNSTAATAAAGATRARAVTDDAATAAAVAPTAADQQRQYDGRYMHQVELTESEHESLQVQSFLGLPSELTWLPHTYLDHNEITW